MLPKKSLLYIWHILRGYTYALFESDTHAKLIDPALPARGWMEETTDIVEIVEGQAREQILILFLPKALNARIPFNRPTKYRRGSVIVPGITHSTNLKYVHSFTQSGKPDWMLTGEISTPIQTTNESSDFWTLKCKECRSLPA